MNLNHNLKICLLFAAAGLMMATLAILGYILLQTPNAPRDQAMASPAFCGKDGHPVYSMVDTKCFHDRVLQY
jgi:hypothetical protein